MEKTHITQTPMIYLGRRTIQLLQEMGRIAVFFSKGLLFIFYPPFQFSKIVKQVYFIGTKSIFVVCLTGAFTGMVLGIQGYYSLAKFGIMRISEQIDALETMDIHPIRYLISPKIAAALISFPILTAMFDLVGIFGGYLTASILLDMNPAIYFSRIESSVVMTDVTGGFIKSIVFALVVITICCYQGYFTHIRPKGFGAEGVSYATTTAVVQSCVLILVTDYIITSFLL